MAYRSINQNFSDDEYIAGLPKDGKLLALALIVCKASHFTGLYHARADVLAVEWGMTADQVAFYLRKFTRDGWAYWDAKTNTVWVKSMFRHQTYEDMTKPQCEGAVKHIKTLRSSVLIPEFWHHYDPALKAAGIEYPWGTLPDTLGDTLSTTLLGGSEDIGLGLGLSADKVKDKGSPSAPAPGVPPSNSSIKARFRSKSEAAKKPSDKPKSVKKVGRQPKDWTKVPVLPECLELAEHLACLIVDVNPDHTGLTDAKREGTLRMWGKVFEELPLKVVLSGEAKRVITWAMADDGDGRWKGWRNVITNATSIVRSYDNIRAQMPMEPKPAPLAPPPSPFAKKEVAK